MSQSESLLNVAQVAERLNVSLSQARRLISQMHPVNVSAGLGKYKQRRVKPDELERWIELHLEQPEYGIPVLVKPQQKKTLSGAAWGQSGPIPYRHCKKKQLSATERTSANA